MRNNTVYDTASASVPLTVGSLFSGIGGFDLGLERVGMQVKWQVEIDPYCQRVLAKHWPYIRRYTDITKIDWSCIEPVDLICGGFPCQDISIAGKGRGLSGDRSGLWWHMLHAIRMVRPRYVIVENVAMLLKRGMGEIQQGLAEIGYDTEWDSIPASIVGAPMQRYRIYLVAKYQCKRNERIIPKEIQRFKAFSWNKNVRGIEDLRKRPNIPEPLFRGGRDGLPNWMDRLRGLGNSVVPQIVEAIGLAIMSYHEKYHT